MASGSAFVYSMLCILAGALLAVLYVSVPTFQAFFTLPAINDITTDPADPPGFIALDVPPYPADLAEVQRAGYPDLGPLVFDVPLTGAFLRAQSTALDMGWIISVADGEQGRIEAVATTRLLGFKDDVVVRLRPAGDGTRVDLRSRSRTGKHDLGANARRINAFLDRLQR